MKKILRTRLDRLDAKGYATLNLVTIELELCATQADYERAFVWAWNQVPVGAIVYCWLRPLSDAEYCAMAEGRQAQPHDVMGIYLKPRMIE